MADPKALHRQFGIYLVESTRERFVDQSDPKGRKWKPSARAKEEGGKTLTDKAGLRDSQAWKATARAAHAGTNKKYGRIHQLGGVIRPKKAKALRFQIGGEWVMVKKVTMPKRPYLGINKQDKKEFKMIVRKHIADSFL